MSFSKAKLHRFNDDIPCAPPPGAYNPEKINKSVGPIIHKTERFVDSKVIGTASSTDSINSLSSEKGTSSTGCSSTFKTPRIPIANRGLSRTDVRKKGDFSQSKAASTDYINKRSNHKEHEMNPFRYSLYMLQDELAAEKSRNQQLLVELDHLKENTSESSYFSEWLVDMINEKNKLIDLLTEKCRIFQQISTESFESYQSYVKNVYEILESHYRLSSKTDSDLMNLVERYEKLVSEYEQDIESLFIFMVDLQQKQSNMAYSNVRLDGSSEQCNFLIETLKETEKGRRKYEIVVQEMQKVINVLSGRVHESDREVEKMYEVVSTMNQEKGKLDASIRSKEEEIARMRDIIEAVSKKFFNEVHDAESNLLHLVDEFKERANVEKEKYETNLKYKDSIIAELLTMKNEAELKLQVSLDQIEILKCKEENLQKTFDQVQNDLRDKCTMFENAYKDCCEKLADLEETYELGNTKIKMGEFDSLEKYTKQRNESVNKHAELAKKIVESLVQNDLLSSDVINRFDDIEDPEESMIMLQELLMSNFTNESNNKSVFLRHLIDAISTSFSKFVKDINVMKNDFTRLRDDLIEKCDECGQLTRLLQLSEKNLEVSEKKTNELVSSQNELEKKFKEQQKQIDLLESENVNLKQQLAFEQNIKESELIIGDSVVCIQQSDRMVELEAALKEARLKIENLEEKNSKLEIALFENRETEKNARPISKYVPERNRELKSKHVMKLKNEFVQPKKKNHELIQKNCHLKGGKENQLITKNNETYEVKRSAPAENPVNTTYVVTSPKVSRI